MLLSAVSSSFNASCNVARANSTLNSGTLHMNFDGKSLNARLSLYLSLRLSLCVWMCYAAQANPYDVRRSTSLLFEAVQWAHVRRDGQDRTPVPYLVPGTVLATSTVMTYVRTLVACSLEERFREQLLYSGIRNLRNSYEQRFPILLGLEPWGWGMYWAYFIFIRHIAETFPTLDWYK